MGVTRLLCDSIEKTGGRNPKQEKLSTSVWRQPRQLMKTAWVRGPTCPRVIDAEALVRLMKFMI